MKVRVPLATGYAEYDQRGLVRIADRMVPRRIDVHFGPSPDGQPTLHMVIDVIDGVPRCTRLTISRVDDGREVRQLDLTAVRLTEMIDVIVSACALPLVEGSGGQPVGLISTDDSTRRDSEEVLRRARRGSPRTITDDVLRSVAAIYRDNIDGHPTEAVRAAYNVAPRTASLYVERARAAGLLPPTTRGKRKA